MTGEPQYLIKTRPPRPTVVMDALRGLPEEHNRVQIGKSDVMSLVDYIEYLEQAAGVTYDPKTGDFRIKD